MKSKIDYFSTIIKGMENYTKVTECFIKAGCQLLTSYEEFERRRNELPKKFYHFVRVEFIGTCSHESSVVFTNFKLRKTGIVCKECIRKQSSVAERQNCNEIELMGIKIVEEYLKGYDILRTKEGCRADLAIKKKTDDNWIPIQIKTSLKQMHNMYSFKQCNKDYSGMLLFCICISEKKIWVLPFSTELPSSINISLKSKYDKYLVVNENLAESIEKYNNSIIMQSLDAIMLPVNPLQQREQEYVRKREAAIPFLAYTYPDIQSGISDFICNGKKVQEKVLGLDKKTLHANLSVNNGKKYGKRSFRSYMVGENDYYWFHSSIDDRFWIIPEGVLVEKGYVTVDKEKRTDIRISGNEWDKYKYNYKEFDEKKIIGIFL